MGVPLDYANVADAGRGPSRRAVLIVVAVVAALVLALILPTLPARTVVRRMDAVTGSVSHQTRYPFGFTTTPTVTPSPLERRLRRDGIAWTPAWRFVNETSYDALGQRRASACGGGPPILVVAPILGLFATDADDAEVREFVGTMEFGTDAERQAAVDAMFDGAVEVR